MGNNYNTFLPSAAGGNKCKWTLMKLEQEQCIQEKLALKQAQIITKRKINKGYRTGKYQTKTMSWFSESK